MNNKRGQIIIDIENEGISSTMSIKMKTSGPMDIFNAAKALFKAIPDDAGKAFFLKEIKKMGYDEAFVEKYTMSNEELDAAIGDFISKMGDSEMADLLKDLRTAMRKEKSEDQEK